MLRQRLAHGAWRSHVSHQMTRSIHDSPKASFATGPDPSTFPLYKPPPPEADYVAPRRFKMPKSLDELPSEADILRETKAQITKKAIDNVPEYNEDALRDFYRSVVLSGSEKQQPTLPQIDAPKTSLKERKRLLAGLEERLQTPKEGEEQAAVPALPDAPQHVALTAALINLAPEAPQSSLNIPLGVVKHSEWQALFDTFVARSDGPGAEVLLNTMERHGILPSVEQLNEIIGIYAQRGRTSEVARLIADVEEAGVEITDGHRDMLISSYVSGPNPDVKAVLEVLKSAEGMARPFPQSSYNVVLSHLTQATALSQTDSRSRALAWDLFAHMRFAAHAYPIRELYTTMIRTCGDSRDPQPERARDLWVEMTQDAGIEPTRHEYDAIIRALGSTKRDYLEAYDLLRQMLGKHQEAISVPFEDEPTSLVSPWVPTIETFTALLEGTKRAGDLGRARWVLSEVVDLARVAAFSGHTGLRGPDDEMMVNVFQTYAAWRPTVTRKTVKPRAAIAAEAEAAVDVETDVNPDAAPAKEAEPATAGESISQTSNDVASTETDNSVSAGPTTSAEALREAEALFARIVEDVQAAEAGNTLNNPFHGVRVTPRLINSYISVHLSHAATLADARAAFVNTWSAFAGDSLANLKRPQPNGWTYIQVLERVARGKLPKEDRAVAYEWGAATWQMYSNWEAVAESALGPGIDGASRRRRWLVGLGERQIEKAWIAAIRLAALADDTKKAMGLFNEFVRRHPASALLETYTPQLRPGLAMRMSEPATIAEPHLPPHLLFRDIDVLHQRLVRDEETANIKRVKWAITAYEHSLGKRRRFRIRGAGVNREMRKLQQQLQQMNEAPAVEGGVEQAEEVREEERHEATA